MTQKKRHLEPGFTLIEVLLAVTIGALIIGGSLYLATTVMENAKRNNTKTALQTIKSQIQMYKSERGQYPQNLPELKKAGFFKKEVPKDGWDNPVVYRLTPDGKHPFDLYSYGPEGKGSSKASRISVWGSE